LYGAGYVGGPTMAAIADRCPEINVTLVDKVKMLIRLIHGIVQIFQSYLSMSLV